MEDDAEYMEYLHLSETMVQNNESDPEILNRHNHYKFNDVDVTNAGVKLKKNASSVHQKYKADLWVPYEKMFEEGLTKYLFVAGQDSYLSGNYTKDDPPFRVKPGHQIKLVQENYKLLLRMIPFPVLKLLFGGKLNLKEFMDLVKATGSDQGVYIILDKSKILVKYVGIVFGEYATISSSTGKRHLNPLYRQKNKQRNLYRTWNEDFTVLPFLNLDNTFLSDVLIIGGIELMFTLMGHLKSSTNFDLLNSKIGGLCEGGWFKRGALTEEEKVQISIGLTKFYETPEGKKLKEAKSLRLTSLYSGKEGEVAKQLLREKSLSYYDSDVGKEMILRLKETTNAYYASEEGDRRREEERGI